jgi:hypothetical protein
VQLVVQLLAFTVSRCSRFRSWVGQTVTCKYRPVNEETNEDLFIFDCRDKISRTN